MTPLTRDPVLLHFLQTVLDGSDGKNKMAITVVVHGVMLSGYAVSAKRYASLLAARMKAALERDMPEAESGTVATALERIAVERGDEFLHMEDPHTIGSGAVTGQPAYGLWRIPLAHIGAFTFGPPGPTGQQIG